MVASGEDNEPFGLSVARSSFSDKGTPLSPTASRPGQGNERSTFQLDQGVQHDTQPPLLGTSHDETFSQHQLPTHASQTVVDLQGRILNPRSCVTCRKRKVRCDKLHPCTNCTKNHIECVYPGPGRAPRRSRKNGLDGRDAGLFARLKRLEAVVKDLGVPVDHDEPPRTEIGEAGQREGHTHSAPNAADISMSQTPDLSSHAKLTHAQAQFPAQRADDNKVSNVENRFGRLVINEGRSRYVNNSFWASLSNEVEDLKGILNEDSDGDAEQDSVDMAALQGLGPDHRHHHHGWIFGFNSRSVDLLSLHPAPMHIQAYWVVYKQRVDPLVKVLHIPTLESTVLTAASHLANLAKGFEALLFAIYYGATTSLTTSECLEMFGEEREVLLTRYRFAIEQSLGRANFLTTEEIVVVQAFVIFLICLRRNDAARVIWTLTGLIVRMAQTLGIHRDGSHFNLSPFEIEMRRRLWWQVCILDVRASEDHGCDPTIVEQQFDTKMPLNINDTDIDPSMKVAPAERQGCTDLSFSLIRFEVANTFRRLNYVPPGLKGHNEVHTAATLQEKEHWIAACHDQLETKYLKHCDMTVPIFWVTATVARLMMTKMWLMIYHPFQRLNGGADLPDDIREKLFITSLENMEYAVLLETESRTVKYGWLFKTYMQWHAIAFILSELCHRTRGDLVERAWLAVEKTRRGHWDEITDDGRKGHLWKPLNRLFAKAKAVRQTALFEDGIDAGRPTYESPQQQLPVGSTAELLTAMKQKPGLVSAPLSTAQLTRNMTPTPTYGTQPIDSVKLLQSPVLAKTSDTDFGAGVRDTLSMLPGSGPVYSQQEAGLSASSWSAQTVPEAAGLRGDMLRKGSVSNRSADMYTAGLPNGGRSQGFPNNDTSSVMEAAPDTDLAASFGDNGEMDWEGWDRLVRQFGMDVDDVSGQSIQASNWGASDWEKFPDHGASGTSMGMRGSDWF